MTDTVSGFQPEPPAASAAAPVPAPGPDGPGRRGAAAGKKEGPKAKTWCRLTPGPEAAGEAREAMAGWLAWLGADSDAVFPTLLAVSEVAANAGVHGEPPVTLTASAQHDGGDLKLVVAVGDCGVSLPRQRRAGDMDESGRGMQLAEAFTDRLETVSLQEGKEVRFWVTIPARAHAPGSETPKAAA